MSKVAESESGFKSTLRSLDQYWFGHGSATSLGLIRILVGTIAFLNLVMVGLYWESWFSEKGYVPAWIGQMFLRNWEPVWWNGAIIPRLDVITGITDPRITIPFYVIVTVSALLTALGLWTRVSTIVLAIGLVSLHHRNAAILHGGDTILRIYCLYMAVSPCGTACSLDRLFALWRGKIASGAARISLWPQRLIAYNIALLYFTTTWLKFDGSYWRDGIATYFPARLAEFYRFPVPGFVSNTPFVYLTTYATLAVEFALGTLVFFRPIRNWVVLAGVCMHLWIDYSMNIPLFSYLMISGYISFFDGEEWERWAERMGNRLSRFKVTVRIPRHRGLRPEAASFLKAIDPFHLVSYEPGSDEGWVATRSDGKTMAILKAEATRNIGALIFSWIPGLWKRILAGSLQPVASRES